MTTVSVLSPLCYILQMTSTIGVNNQKVLDIVNSGAEVKIFLAVILMIAGCCSLSMSKLQHNSTESTHCAFL